VRSSVAIYLLYWAHPRRGWEEGMTRQPEKLPKQPVGRREEERGEGERERGTGRGRAGPARRGAGQRPRQQGTPGWPRVVLAARHGPRSCLNEGLRRGEGMRLRGIWLDGSVGDGLQDMCPWEGICWGERAGAPRREEKGEEEKA
jgi:hypothetical protein